MVFFALQNALGPQLADLTGQAAAVYLQIVGQTLPIVGDRKAVAALELGLAKEIGHQFFPGSALRSDLDLLIVDQIFGGHLPQQIKDNAAVEGAGAGAAGGDAAAIHQQHGAVGIGHDTHRQSRYPCAGVGFGKKLGRAYVSHDGAVAVVILPYQLDSAGEHHAYIFGRLAFPQDELALCCIPGMAADTAHHSLQILHGDAVKEGTFFEDGEKIFHGYTSLLKIQHTFCP